MHPLKEKSGWQGGRRIQDSEEKIVQILQNQLYSSVDKNQGNMSKQQIAKELLLYGLVMKSASALRGKAANIIAVLKKRQKVLGELLKTIENQRLEVVSEFLDRLITTARTIAQASNKKKKTFNKETLLEALDIITQQLDPSDSDAALAA